MVIRNQEAWPAADSDDSSSSSEGERSLPEKKIANLKSKKKKPTEYGSDPDSEVPPKVKKTRTKTVAKTPMKRSAAAAVEAEKASKKSKEKGAEDTDGKKSALFQRLWSDEDEIVILKGILDYEEAKGVDPMADANAFHDFIKKSLHVEVDRKQLTDKVRKLRRRYHNSVGKKNKTFSSHEKATIELSEKIWGNKAAIVDDDRKVSEPSVDTRSKETKGVEKTARSWQFVGKASISMGLDENIVKVGLEICEEDRKGEIEEKWRQLHLEESSLFSRKLDLAREECKMITEAFRSGKE